MSGAMSAIIGPASEARDYAPILRWLLLNCVVVFILLVLWNFGFLQAMLDTDHTRVSVLILGVFALTVLHCLYQTVIVSQEAAAARKASEVLERTGGRGLTVVDNRVYAADGTELEPGILTAHVARLVAKARNQRDGGKLDQTLLLRTLADKLRSRLKLGWFVSEALLRLALLGTAIGFILMLIPIAGLSSFDAETLRTALSGMSGGMAIALNVTVAGIGTALALKLEYYFLDGAVAEVFNTITETTEVHVVPALEHADARA